MVKVTFRDMYLSPATSRNQRLPVLPVHFIFVTRNRQGLTEEEQAGRHGQALARPRGGQSACPRMGIRVFKKSHTKLLELMVVREVRR